MERALAAADEDLVLIPRRVRDKLDRVRIKLHLREWQALSLGDRELLCTLPCDDEEEATAYTACLNRIVEATTGQPPQSVSAKP